MINFGILIGISVERILGIDAEKKRMDEMATVAMINFVIKGASTTSSAGRNISAIPTAEAFAARKGSGICKFYVNG